MLKTKKRGEKKRERSRHVDYLTEKHEKEKKREEKKKNYL